MLSFYNCFEYREYPFWFNKVSLNPISRPLLRDMLFDTIMDHHTKLQIWILTISRATEREVSGEASPWCSTWFSLKLSCKFLTIKCVWTRFRDRCFATCYSILLWTIIRNYRSESWQLAVRRKEKWVEKRRHDAVHDFYSKICYEILPKKLSSKLIMMTPLCEIVQKVVMK